MRDKTSPILLPSGSGRPHAAESAGADAPAYWPELRQIARLVYPAAGWAGRAQRFVFLVRHLAHYQAARRWIEYLARPSMAALTRDNPGLYRKVIRPYVSRDWPAAVKVKAMISHYQFLRQATPPDVFRQIAGSTGATLAEFSLRNNERLTVRLRFDSKFRKEGETTLELLSAVHQCRVYSLTFVVAAGPAGEPCLIIGAVSGLPASADKNIIKEVAKAMFGLRPKSLLLLVLQEVARGWGVHRLLGVGSRIHTSRHPAYLLNRSRRFAIAYDEFWAEAGGVRRGDGFFDLPLVYAERPLATVESHKRSLYRQRYAWINELQAALRLQLLEWRSENAPAPDPKPALPARGAIGSHRHVSAGASAAAP